MPPRGGSSLRRGARVTVVSYDMGRHVLDDRHLSAGWGSKKGGGMKLNRRLLERSRQHLDARITDHDQSGNGKFNLIPRTVTIAEGETVTYDIFEIGRAHV